MILSLSLLILFITFSKVDQVLVPILSWFALWNFAKLPFYWETCGNQPMNLNDPMVFSERY